MSILYVVGAVVSALLFVYLVYALVKAEEFSMTTRSWLLLAVFLVVLFATVRPLGLYIARLIEGGPRTPLLARLEEGVFRLCGIREEMGWRQYTLAVLVFSVIGAVAVYALQRLQPWLPLNPQALANVSPDSAFNTAVSFASNTNWQGYGGETTMSYLTQMLGLAVQNFLSAATGMVIVETIALSTMVCNDLVMPLALRIKALRLNERSDLSGLLLGIRRWAIVAILLLGYIYFRAAGEAYALVGIGLISFAAVAQFAPAIFGGIYWKGGTRNGAIAGLLGGFVVNAAWCLTQNAKNRTFGDYSKGGSLVVPNIFFAGLAGVIWAMQFVCQKVGEPAMGDMAYIGFAIVMGSSIFFSSLVGILLGEWRGVGTKTKTLLGLGIVTLLVSFCVISYGNKLKEQASRPEVMAEKEVQKAVDAVERLQK